MVNRRIEREYIFGTAYIETMCQLRKTKEYKSDQSYFNALPIMTGLMETLDKMEALKKTLIARYEEFEEAKKLSEKMEKQKADLERKQQLAEARKTSKELEAILGGLGSGIEPETLVKLLKNHGNEVEKCGGILLLDIRKREEFNRNRIKTPDKWYKPAYVHIPIGNATPGAIGTKLIANSLQKEDYGKRHFFKLGMI